MGVIAAVFLIYLFGIQTNPPGFYVDESGLAYNAYLVSQTGAGEFGPRFPLYFQIYGIGFEQYANPTHIYLLAGVFSIFGPSILAARILAAASVFLACLLLSGLAWKISGSRIVAVIIGFTALTLPWMFQVGRVVLETFFYPAAVALFLWAVYRTYKKEEWDWDGILPIVGALALLTYSYTIGRLLGPLLAFALIFLVTNRKQIFSVSATWLAYGITLFPLAYYLWQRPEITNRFRALSYIKPESSWLEIFATFVRRYFEDINPLTILFAGDTNARHHLPEALGSIFLTSFVIALIGLVVALTLYRKDRWWRFAAFGLAASAVPGALTTDSFHTLRMVAFPVFVILFMIPGLKWLLIDGWFVRRDAESNRKWIAAAILLFTLAEASYFHYQFFVHGPSRGYAFDADYKPLYDKAVASPQRPIYLIDGRGGPAYIHALWYSIVEGRSKDEFVHMPFFQKLPPDSLVLSSEGACRDCRIVAQTGPY
ncbi:MAG: glycosyltransferase family 39 protein, partial [Acidobacteria bacterium]|nr:glycosyltransferase family 39 protein [Acidobacteriota bacterium]